MNFPKEQIEQSIPRRFELQVATHPDRAAVAIPGQCLNYGQINRQANRVAHAISRRWGTGSAAVMPLLSQGPGLTAAILGILKAGKFYVGTDPRYPPARLVQMVRDSRAELIIYDIVHQELAAALAGSGTEVLSLDLLLAEPLEDNPGWAIPVESPAYLFYTSGSTGRPKGVVDCHRNVLHNVMRYTNSLSITCADRLTLLQSCGFSGSVSSLFGALLNGACSVPLDLHQHSAAEVARWLRQERLTIYHSVPAVFRDMVIDGGTFPDLRVIRLEGDQASQVDVTLFNRHFADSCVLVNGLGTTETGLVTQFVVKHGDEAAGGVLPVGFPVEDMHLLVLDDQRQPVPAGEVGEIAVGSRFLALGYYNDPDLTARSFVGSDQDPAYRTYFTGDIGRLRPDGCLEHLGRRDSRLKIRGYTVEAAEVESALLAVGGIREAAVVARADDRLADRLVAYFTSGPGDAPSVPVLRRKLRDRLPDYMVPSVFIQLDRLPRNENGKTDRSRLPPPDQDRPPQEVAYLPARSLGELQLVKIWEDLLGVRPVGVRDEFFDLGGDSLLAVLMLTRIEEDMGVELPPSVLLEMPTVEGLAGSVQKYGRQVQLPMVEVQRGTVGPPFYYLHGDYLTGGSYCRKLARLMGADVAFYALPPCGLDGRPVPGDYGEMAKRHLAAIRARQPNGPYFVGGTCNGGLVAYEIARRLVAEGEQVALCAMFAASAANVRFRPWRRLVSIVARVFRAPPVAELAAFVRLREIVMGFEGRSLTGKLTHALRKASRLPGELRNLATMSVKDGAVAGAATAEPAIVAKYHLIDTEYIPGHYPGRITLLWPEGESETAEQAVAYWQEVAGSADLRVLPSTHLACLTRDAAVLAGALAEALSQAREPTTR